MLPATLAVPAVDPATPASAGRPLGAVLTRGSTSAVRGTRALIRLTRVATRSPGALTSTAFPAGKPRDRATWSETTASTPPMPTVPNPPTRSDFRVRPETRTVAPAGSLSCLPMV